METESRRGVVDAESLYGDMSIASEDGDCPGYTSCPMDKDAMQWLKGLKAEVSNSTEEFFHHGCFKLNSLLMEWRGKFLEYFYKICIFL